MRVLVIGQGGREHALVKALKSSPACSAVFVAPGNDGMCEDAELVPISTSNQSEILKFCEQKKINLVVIGPEAELMQGLSDTLRKNNILCFGPSQNAAQLESSKIFCKEFLEEFHVPTAKSIIVASVTELKNAVTQFKPPYVLKADGLCAGKGVFICENEASLIEAGKDVFEKRLLGDAGSQALLEEHLSGYELSLLYLTQGTEFILMPICQDHKRLKNNDLGPNTGGMGVVGPMQVEPKLLKQIESEILVPIKKGFKSRKFDFRGVLYVGLMITKTGPKVLEFNVRFGDPEAQVILPLLAGDWCEVFHHIAKGEVPHVNWLDDFIACVVMAAEGYPLSPKKNVVIQGDVHAHTPNSYFIHAGTKLENSKYVTNGGRVIAAVGIGQSLKEAINHAYTQAKGIEWPGMQMRMDIGAKASS